MVAAEVVVPLGEAPRHGEARDHAWPPAQQWGLVAPAAGEHDLVVTFSSPAYAVLSITVFDGVDPSTPVGTTVHAHGDDMTLLSGSVDVAATPDQLVVDVMCTDASTGAHSLGDGQTLLAGGDAPDGETVSVSSKPGAAAMSRSWPNDASSQAGWSIVATPLIPAP